MCVVCGLLCENVCNLCFVYCVIVCCVLLLCVCFMCDVVCDAVGLSSLRVCVCALNVVYCVMLYGLFVFFVCVCYVFCLCVGAVLNVFVWFVCELSCDGERILIVSLSKEASTSPHDLFVCAFCVLWCL